MEKISINITTYNRAHLLPRCIESVIFQSYKNIEIIIVDDCSDDNTQKVVSELQKRDKRIKYFRHEKNRGNAEARNTAMKNSLGEYIAFLDDDDEWIDKNKLEKQLKIIEKNKADIVCSSVRLYSNKKKFKEKIIQKPKNLKKWMLKRNGIIYSPTILIKKEIMDKVGGFDKNLERGVDSDFYRNCILNFGYKIYFLKDITTAIYEYGNDRMTPQKNYNSIMKNIKANKYIIKKYFKWFLIYPGCLIYRIKIILLSYIIQLR